MSKEKYNQIVDEAYENYYENFYKLSDSKKWMKKNFFYDGSSNHHVYLKEEFINKCKTDTEFSEKWGLKIEERELTYDEKVHEARRRFGFELEDGTRTFDINKTETIKFLQSTQRIISLTYNNETIEVYE